MLTSNCLQSKHFVINMSRFAVGILPSVRQSWETFAGAGGETKELTPGRYNHFLDYAPRCYKPTFSGVA